MGSHRNHVPLGVVTILNGASLSDAIDCGEYLYPVALQMPAGWTAAGLSFQSSADGVTYGELSDKTGLLSVASASVVAGAYIILDAVEFESVRFLKVRSGTLAAPVVQLADRAIKVMVDDET